MPIPAQSPELQVRSHCAERMARTLPHMARRTQRETRTGGGSNFGPGAASAIDRMVEGGARCYSRARDLPCLLPLWPRELADFTAGGTLRILAKLRRALRAERRRARAGHWSYELNRHIALLAAYKGEIALLRAETSLSRHGPGAARQASGAAPSGIAAKDVLRLPKRVR
jgi:hypothetical protein